MHGTDHNLELSETLRARLDEAYAAHANDDEGRQWAPHETGSFFRDVQGEDDGLGDNDNHHHSHDEFSSHCGSLDREGFARYISSPSASAAARVSVSSDPAYGSVEQDLSWPLAAYFCSSSHNTYLTGDQLASDSDVEMYRKVLRRGCRCIEIDVWDGGEHIRGHEEGLIEEGALAGEPADTSNRKLGFRMRTMLKVGNFVLDKIAASDSSKPQAKQDALDLKARFARFVGVEPVVLHGHTLTKEVPFREVCEAVRDTAFETSDLPVVVSLEVHCSPAQQEMMVDIMRETWDGMLLDGLPDDDLIDNPPPLSGLRGKILVKVKYAPPVHDELDGLSIADTTDSLSIADSTASSSSTGTNTKKKAPKVKTIPLLSDMALHTRGVTYKGMALPEASMPGHIFSVSEAKLPKAYDAEPGAFFAHNKRHLMRTYPAGTRVDSSNMDPSAHWRRGAQFAALNWQTLDDGMMLNEAMFEGTRGYLLKPDGYRGSQNHHHDRREPEIRDLTYRGFRITLLAAQGVPRSTYTPDLKPYVAAKVFADPHPLNNPPGTSSAREPVARESMAGVVKRLAEGSGDEGEGAGAGDADFNLEVLDFGDVERITPELSFLLVKVMNAEPGRDPVLGWACVRLDRLRKGYRVFRLRDGENKGIPGSGLLVKIEMDIEEARYD
ncbi:PLC-like phosphodiesterase [Microdochium bolleyi]|uniref:Phosphoinositide phospholipase C n=1 Tax=Microdochium bolleyi TaxID=196109 RepID=A0A136ILE0_9PEZI|nr:PLC-like phosphodiesterase [Microdochium bolleyi]